MDERKHLLDLQRKVCSHHDFDKLEMLGTADASDIVEEDGKLDEIKCIRDFREDSLELHFYDCK